MSQWSLPERAVYTLAMVRELTDGDKSYAMAKLKQAAEQAIENGLRLAGDICETARAVKRERESPDAGSSQD